MIVINEIDEMDLRTVQPKFREFMDSQASSDPLCGHHEPQEPHHGGRAQQVPRD